MALKSTVFKAQVQIADIDHAYYADHVLTLARHPSETDERMMVRLVALALQAHKLQTLCAGDGTLALGAGLSSPDEPDLVLRDFSGVTRLWVEVGQAEEKPLARACARADAAVLYCFHHTAPVWWRGMQAKVERLKNLSVYMLPSASTQALSSMAQRGMQLQATLAEGVLMLSDGKQNVDLEPVQWQ